MAHVTVFGAGYSGITGSVASGTNQYGAIGMWGKSSASGGLASADTTEANVKIKARAGGTASKLSVYLRANTYTSTTNVRLRINGANGNLVVACTANTTGGFTDGTHSDTISAGDDVNANWAPTGGSFNSWFIETLLLAFDGTSNAVAILSAGSQASIATASQTQYFPLVGDHNSASSNMPTSETDAVKASWYTAGTLSNLYLRVATNTNTNAATAKSRINSADGNQSISITASTTGVFEDTTHSDTVASGDVINGSVTSGAGTVNLTWNVQAMHFLGSGTAADLISGQFNGSSTWSTSADSFHPPTGFMDTQSSATTEAGQKSYWPIISRLTNLRVRVLVHTSNNNSPTFALRINGSDGAQSVSVTQNTTGQFLDSTHADTTAAGDNVYFRQQHPGSGSLSLSKAGLTVDSTVTSTETGTAALAFGGIAFDATGLMAQVGGSGNLAFGPVAFQAAGTGQHQASGSLDFGGVQFVATGTRPATGTGGLDFDGVHFNAKGGIHGQRTTQAVRLVISETAANARATQAARVTVAEVQANARVTQAVRLSVVEVHADARITQGVRLIIADAVDCVTQWCQLWRITRRDGVVFRFTSLDEDFPWGDETFQACASLNPSATESASALGQVGNLELSGIIASDAITEADLYGGLFDDAFTEVWLVAYDGSGAAPRRIAAGWTGNLSHGEQGFKMEVLGPGARIDQQALVQTVTPSCRWKFGSSQCTIDREARKQTGTVVAATSRGAFACDLSGHSSGDAQFHNGSVVWTSGRNAGQECEVKDVDFESTSTITLWALPAYKPQPGDTFDLLPGCDLLKDTCSRIYANLINFGGFPDVPGDDSIAQTPDAKV